MKIKHVLMAAGILAILFSVKCHAVWDVTTPQGTESKSLGDDRIREFKTDVQSALNTYGVFPGSDTANPKYYWTIQSGNTASRPGNAVSTGTLYVNVSSNCIERYQGIFDGWRCVQAVGSNNTVNISSFSATLNSTQSYNAAMGLPANAIFINNGDTDTNQMAVSMRFGVGNANETRFVVIRDTVSTDSADLAVNVRGGGVRYEPQRWESDGTITFNSSNTFTGTNLFKSSATFTQPVHFASTVNFTGNIIGNLPIRQIQSTQVSFSSSTTSSGYQDTSLAINITPNSATSKIFVLASTGGTQTTSDGKIQIYRNGSAICGELTYAYGSSLANNAGSATIQCYDSPATTSLIRYSVRFKATGGIGTSTLGDSNSGNTITAIEIQN